MKIFFSQWGSLSNWWLLHSFVKAINRRHGRGYGVMAWVMWLLSWPWSLPFPWPWFLWPKELLLNDWYAIWFVTTYNTPFTWAREVKAIVWTFFCKTCKKALHCTWIEERRHFLSAKNQRPARSSLNNWQLMAKSEKQTSQVKSAHYVLSTHFLQWQPSLEYYICGAGVVGSGSKCLER